MNYFAHGLAYTDQPYLLAGTAVPDWLSVIDRRVRARSKSAEPFVGDADPRVADLARGIVRHHEDDHWFHGGAAFAELSLQFTVAIRDLLAPDTTLRPSFLGHILVELLLDAALIEDRPALLDAYYAALAELDPQVVQQSVEQMTGKRVPTMAALIPRFSSEGFLYDYLEDEKLLFRLNQVMRRVKLPPLPPALASLFPAARQSVRARRAELLAGGEAAGRES